MKKWLGILGNMALTIVVYYAVISFALYMWNNVLGSHVEWKPWLSKFRILMLFGNASLFIIVYAIIYRLGYKRSLFEHCRFVAVKGRTVTLSALLGAAMGVWIMSLYHTPAVTEAFPIFKPIFRSMLRPELWAFALFVTVNSVYKEVLYRGLLYNELRRGFSVVPASIIIGLLYGLLFFQWDIPLTVYGSLGAIIFCLLYEWYKSIWVTIVNEFILFVVYYVLWRTTVPYGVISYSLIAISSIVVFVCMYLLWKERDGVDSAIVKSRAASLT